MADSQEREIEITPEMIEAGDDALHGFYSEDLYGESRAVVCAVYLAMARFASKPDFRPSKVPR